MKRPIRDVILQAAAALARSSPHGFSESMLIVTAWQLDPLMVGLEGFESKYPDANRIKAALMGRKGLVAQGKLIRTAAGRYTLASSKTKGLRPMSEVW